MMPKKKTSAIAALPAERREVTEMTVGDMKYLALPFEHRLPQPPLRLAGASAHHGACHVAEIPALRVARKNIENDQRVRG